MNVRLLILCVIQSFLLSAGQITLKLAMVRAPRFTFDWTCIKAYLVNWWFLVCGICFASSTVLWMHILKNYPLSESYPLTSLAYVFGMLAGIFVFNESSSVHKWIGVLLIVAGAFLLTKK